MPAGDPGPASVSVTDRERRRAEHLAVRQRVEAVLRQRWPAVFCTPRVPLRIGIREDILALAGEDIDPRRAQCIFAVVGQAARLRRRGGTWRGSPRS